MAKGAKPRVITEADLQRMHAEREGGLPAQADDNPQRPPAEAITKPGILAAGGHGRTLVGVTPAAMSAAHKALLAHLASAISEAPVSGDLGRISAALNDIEALGRCEPARADHAPAPPKVYANSEERRIAEETAKRQAAAGNDALMQQQNAETNARERAKSEKEFG